MRGVLTLVALLLIAAPAAAQTTRAAVIVEWDAEGSRTLRETVRANLMARGFDVVSDDALDAARAFGGTTGALDNASAAALRERTSVDVLVWVTARSQGDRLLVAVRRVVAEGIAEAFGAAAPEQISARVVTLIEQTWAGTASAVAPAAPAPPAPAPSAPAPSAPAPAPAPVAPVVPHVAVPPSPLASPVLAPGNSLTQTAPIAPPQPTVAATAAAPAPVAELVTAPAPAASVPETAPPEAEAPEARGRTERVRLALVAFAGIEAYGYGAGARLELPLVSLLSGTDDSLSLGIDLGVSYVSLGIDDQGNGVEAAQFPGAAYLTWRIGVDDVEIGPRLGGVLALRVGEFTGPRLTGSRISVVGMALVGISLAGWIDDSLQLFGGLDLAIGPRVSGIISAGVAL